MKPNYFRWNMPSFTDYYGHWYWMGCLAPRSGLVYILHVGGDYYKIGMSNNPGRRIAGFKSSNPFIEGHGTKNIVALLAPSEDECSMHMPTARTLERFIHKYLRSKGKHANDSGPGSEIFKLSENDLKELYEYLMENGNRKKEAWNKKDRTRIHFGGIAPRSVVGALMRQK